VPNFIAVLNLTFVKDKYSHYSVFSEYLIPVIKVKLSLCLTKHHAMKKYLGVEV
jgi:hypothetical protein